jgi:hypothetical protein
METSNPQIRVLRRAMAFSGGREPLARELGVTIDDIDEWLSGESELPEDSFIAASELVAFSEQRRRPASRRRAARHAAT